MLDVLEQDYMIEARAKGLSRRDVIMRHGIKNAIASIITLVALQVGHILGGAVVIETIFAWPGLGDLFISAVNAKDTPMVEGCTILIAFGYAFFNLVADIVYAAIDPRVKYADSLSRGITVLGRGKIQQFIDSKNWRTSLLKQSKALYQDRAENEALR